MWETEYDVTLTEVLGIGPGHQENEITHSRRGLPHNFVSSDLEWESQKLSPESTTIPTTSQSPGQILSNRM